MGAVPGGQIKGAAKGAVSALSTAITVRLSLTLILSGNCIIYIFIFLSTHYSTGCTSVTKNSNSLIDEIGIRCTFEKQVFMVCAHVFIRYGTSRTHWRNCLSGNPL